MSSVTFFGTPVSSRTAVRFLFVYAAVLLVAGAYGAYLTGKALAMQLGIGVGWALTLLLVLTLRLKVRSEWTSPVARLLALPREPMVVERSYALLPWKHARTALVLALVPLAVHTYATAGHRFEAGFLAALMLFGAILRLVMKLRKAKQAKHALLAPQVVSDVSSREKP